MNLKGKHLINNLVSNVTGKKMFSIIIFIINVLPLNVFEDMAFSDLYLRYTPA